MQVSATLDLFNGEILDGIKDDTSLRIAGASQSDSVAGFLTCNISCHVNLCYLTEFVLVNFAQ